MQVYEFLYCSCIYESASATISIHLSKEGAQKAMAWHREEKRKEWQEIVDRDPNKGTENGFDKICPFGEVESWDIIEAEILP